MELPNTVEGMIRISEMPGHFEYDGKIEVKDRDSGRRFRIGDRIRVKVAGAGRFLRKCRLCAGRVLHRKEKRKIDEKALCLMIWQGALRTESLF